eukprot:m.159325 g.159325  ORF g.159325 m.159325 type:complete len:500 (+) comp16488_c0_seq5:112-1611(+)
MSDASRSPTTPEAYQDTSSIMADMTRSPLRLLGSSVDELVDRRHQVELQEFKLHETLGEGSFGCVYLASYRRSLIAVKALFDPVMFQEEADILSQLSHRNIIRYLGEAHVPSTANIGFFDLEAGSELPSNDGAILRGRFLLLTEFANAGTLHTMIYQQTYPVLDAMQWMLQITRGLAYLHHEGPVRLLHLDVKPLNVLLVEESSGKFTCKLADLGTAMMAQDEQDCVKSKEQKVPLPKVRGTIRYMAPELIRGEKVCDRADVWSLAVTCVEMLSKEMPYQQYSNNLTVTYKIGSLNLHPTVPCSAPSALQALLTTCFMSDPDVRPTVLVVRHQLEDILQEADPPPSPTKADVPLRQFKPRDPSRRLQRHKSLPARRKMRLLNENFRPEAVRVRSGKQQSTGDGVVWDQLVTPHADVIRNKALRLDALQADLRNREAKLDKREAQLKEREAELDERSKLMSASSGVAPRGSDVSVSTCNGLNRELEGKGATSLNGAISLV